MPTLIWSCVALSSTSVLVLLPFECPQRLLLRFSVINAWNTDHPSPLQVRLRTALRCSHLRQFYTETACSIATTRWPHSRAWRRTGCAKTTACPCAGRDVSHTWEESFRRPAATTTHRMFIVNRMDKDLSPSLRNIRVPYSTHLVNHRGVPWIVIIRPIALVNHKWI